MGKFYKNYRRELSVILAIGLAFVIFGVMEPIYFRVSNIRDIIEQATIYGLMGIGMTGIIITGGIDLSVGSALALVCAVVSQCAVNKMPNIVIIFVGLALSFVIGLTNGLLITKLKLQPFVATMGTMSVFRGLAYVITNGYPVLGVPDSYRVIFNSEIIPNVKVSVLVFFAFAIVITIFLKKTCVGTYIYAVGGNEEASRLSGVKVGFVKNMAYAVGMLGTGLAALILVSMLGTGDPTTGQGYELNAIAAAAIGGTSMVGGRGNIFGTVLGAILFSALKVGLIVLAIDTFYQFIATGLVIIIAAYIEVIQGNMMSRNSLATSRAK